MFDYDTFLRKARSNIFKRRQRCINNGLFSIFKFLHDVRRQKCKVRVKAVFLKSVLPISVVHNILNHIIHYAHKHNHADKTSLSFIRLISPLFPQVLLENTEDMCVARLQEPCKICRNDDENYTISIALQLDVIMNVARKSIQQKNNMIVIPLLFQVRVQEPNKHTHDGFIHPSALLLLDVDICRSCFKNSLVFWYCAHFLIDQNNLREFFWSRRTLQMKHAYVMCKRRRSLL